MPSLLLMAVSTCCLRLWRSKAEGRTAAGVDFAASRLRGFFSEPGVFCLYWASSGVGVFFRGETEAFLVDSFTLAGVPD